MNTKKDSNIKLHNESLERLTTLRKKSVDSWDVVDNWVADEDLLDKLRAEYDRNIEDLDSLILAVEGEIKKGEERLVQYWQNIVEFALSKLGVMRPAAEVFASAWVDAGGRMPVEDAFDRIKVWEQQQGRKVKDESVDEFITFAELAGANQLV